MTSKHERFDRKRIRPVPTADLNYKVKIDQFGRTASRGGSVDELLRSLPDILAAKDLVRAIDRVAAAHAAKSPVPLLFGAHVIKCGLAPCLIPLVRDGIVSSLSTNGAGAIHDYEIARFGATSENVRENLGEGKFGMGGETADGMHGAIREGMEDDLGLGEALGRALNEGKAPHREHSLLAAAWENGVPMTIHVAIGTDITHMHPSASGELIGEATYRDFLTLVAQFEGLTDSSVLLHVGSAVLLPEIVLKAVAMLRNAGSPPGNYLAVNFDMNRSYRPLQNVLSRPAGDGIDLTGHHEIMIPLFVAGLYEKIGR